jgi:hypothetical protein
VLLQWGNIPCASLGVIMTAITSSIIITIRITITIAIEQVRHQLPQVILLILCTSFFRGWYSD